MTGSPTERSRYLSRCLTFCWWASTSITSTPFSPHGDFFTYTINWFEVIDYYRAHGYLLALFHNLSSGPGWYRLMEVSEAFLAPILAKSPYVICIVNYVLFGIATTAFYRLGRRLGLTVWERSRSQSFPGSGGQLR